MSLEERHTLECLQTMIHREIMGFPESQIIQTKPPTGKPGDSVTVDALAELGWLADVLAVLRDRLVWKFDRLQEDRKELLRLREQRQQTRAFLLGRP